MTHSHAEALFHLASYHYTIAAHGERASMARWRDEASIRALRCEVAEIQASRFAQAEARVR